MAILDLSKTLMHDFHYNWIKKQEDFNSQLLFTDLDSLCYHINEDISRVDNEEIQSSFRLFEL